MTPCPKCGAPHQEGTVECPRCGVIFAKFELRAAAADPEPLLPGVLSVEGNEPATEPVTAPVRLARAAALVVLAVWTWQFATKPMESSTMGSILHLPNLVFHEAGHVLFGFFGRFMTVLGGSLTQFALPLVIAGAFIRQRDPFGASVCVWWAGENLLDLAPYIADARALQLVLLGGKTGAEVEGHDWEYLLTQLGWLHLDRTLGLAAQRVGLAMMIGAVLAGAFYIARNRNEPVEEL